LRIRINAQADESLLEADSLSVELQFAPLGEEVSCSNVGGGEYIAVGAIESGVIWRGFVNPSVTDGSTLVELLLSGSDVAGSYEEENPSVFDQNEVGIGEKIEWDFVVQNNGARSDEVYCFRLAEDGGSAISGYDSYPEVHVIRGLVQVRYRWRNDDGVE